jgi:hypothetical protein
MGEGGKPGKKRVIEDKEGVKTKMEGIINNMVRIWI